MDRYGLAVDLGSTAIGYAVVDLSTGEIKNKGISENPGRAYGRDILSRIRAYSVGGAERITGSMRDAIRDMAGREVSEIVVSANTTMNHMLLGLDCEGLGEAPYTPVSLDVGELSLQTDNAAIPVRTLQGFSTFVGGDIVSGVRALGMDRDEDISLLIDLGTNGEMVLKCGDGFLVTSVAAGPAFEDWGLSHGMYGSKVIDICHRLVETGIINRDGSFRDESARESGFPVSGQGRDAVVLTQDDVRDIQLAKAAVRAGIEILIKRADITYGDIKHVYLAGGMGEHLSVTSAFGIGMLPRELLTGTAAASSGEGIVTAVGNTSLKGAIEELIHPDADRLYAIAHRGTPILLSDDESFNDAFVSYMNF